MREIIFREKETTIPEKAIHLVPFAELVRCVDCKHRETIYCPFYQKYKGTKHDDWFCADGERKVTV